MLWRWVSGGYRIFMSDHNRRLFFTNDKLKRDDVLRFWGTTRTTNQYSINSICNTPEYFSVPKLQISVKSIARIHLFPLFFPPKTNKQKTPPNPHSPPPKKNDGSDGSVSTHLYSEVFSCCTCSEILWSIKTILELLYKIVISIHSIRKTNLILN